MTPITVRQALLSDLESLVPLFNGYRQFYGRDSNLGAARDFLTARITHGESVLFIAQEGNVALGFVQLYPSFSSISLARTFILNDIFVLDAWRKRRVGSLLIEAAIEFARASGAVRLSLSTAVTNQTAQALYQSTGWKRDEQFFYYHFAIDGQALTQAQENPCRDT
jgi:ribosomal protein S18 acetylase RimI-like enzyme